MAAAAITHHALTAGQALAGTGVSPMATTETDSTGSSSSDASVISANDFLTLLVTELQNQDPTADTDPNEYVNQLVSVNSLEQLININSTLTTDLGSPSTTSSGSSPASRTAGVAVTTSALAAGVKTAPGNLSIPEASAAAQRVATALDGQARSR
jgi:flagellar basal-body rod modification protein FlgD